MTGFDISGIPIGGGAPFVLIAGPCVLESEDSCFSIAKELKSICGEIGVPLVFKVSYDKANRSSGSSFRGLGIKSGKKLFAKVKRELGLPVTTDAHSMEEVDEIAPFIDIIQIPAFLCRQTDLVVGSAKTGKPVNIKKGQFLAPWDVRNIIDKCLGAGNDKIIITERGSTFGYNNLVVDFKSLPIIRRFGYPVCFDATHSVQLPGGAGTSSGGQREFVDPLVRACMAVGVDALFLETHHEPDEALSDGQNMVPLKNLKNLLLHAKALDAMVKKQDMI
ncbi:MAG TPA: 3-deoxy-8-phosphooctulonate synthase [bacterium]|nr:3-deoxy-8-phosphooctulonate synthase [bacterium]